MLEVDLEKLKAEPVPRLDDIARREQAQYDHQHRTKQADLGLIGKLVGSSTEKAGNISFIVLVVYFGIVVASLFWAKESTSMLLPHFLSILTLVLGYLFGRKGAL